MEDDLKDFYRKNIKNFGGYLGILFISGIYGVLSGSLLIWMLDLEYTHNDSYRLVYAIMALVMAPMVTRGLDDE